MQVTDIHVAEMKERKKALGYTNERIAELSGVPLSTVQKIFAGTTMYPRHETLQALAQVFAPSGTETDTALGASAVSEAAVPYTTKRQGDYTLEDYYALPEDRRVELIDGVLYDMSAPSTIHQLIVRELAFRIHSYIKANSGKCQTITAPSDVRLDCDQHTIVQPDIFVVCNREKFSGGRIEGAPELIIEVLSPSTQRKDAFVKTRKYLDAGVQEYWMVDPDKKRVIVYVFADDIVPRIYGFSDQVPVAIFGGKCIIDFTEIDAEAAFLYS